MATASYSSPSNSTRFLDSRAECLLRYYLKTPLLEHQRHAVAFMKLRERVPFFKVRGGINAHAMGMGKTLEMLALVALDKVLYSDTRCLPMTLLHKEDGAGDDNEMSKRYKQELEEEPGTVRRCTLVVTHETGIRTWKECIQDHLYENSLRWTDYDPTKMRTMNQASLDSQYDLVFLSFNDLINIERKRKKGESSSPHHRLYTLQFRRLIIDEVHRAKNPDTLLFQALLSIHALRRWAMSGTVLVNSQNDIGAVLLIIGMQHPALEAWKERKYSSKEAVYGESRFTYFFCTTALLFLTLVRNHIVADDYDDDDDEKGVNLFVQEAEPDWLCIWGLALPLHRDMPWQEYAQTPERLWELIYMIDQQQQEGVDKVYNHLEKSLVGRYRSFLVKLFPHQAQQLTNGRVFVELMRLELGINVNPNNGDDNDDDRNLFTCLFSRRDNVQWARRIWFRLLLYGQECNKQELDLDFLSSLWLKEEKEKETDKPSTVAFESHLQSSPSKVLDKLRSETCDRIYKYIQRIHEWHREHTIVLDRLLLLQRQRGLRTLRPVQSSQSAAGTASQNGHLVFARPCIDSRERAIIHAFQQKIVSNFQSSSSSSSQTAAIPIETEEEDKAGNKRSIICWFTLTRSILCHPDAVVVSDAFIKSKTWEDLYDQGGRQQQQQRSLTAVSDYYKRLEEEIERARKETQQQQQQQQRPFDRCDYVERTAYKRIVSTKMRMVQEYLQHSVLWKCGERVLIWSNFDSALKMIYWFVCEKLGYRCAFLSGAIKDERERRRIVDRARSPADDLQVLFLTANYCESLNLTLFNHSIFIDGWFNLSKFQQASWRIKRLDQLRHTYSSLFVVDNSFDQVLYSICTAKLMLVRDTFGADASKHTHLVDSDASKPVSSLSVIAQRGHAFEPISTSTSMLLVQQQQQQSNNCGAEQYSTNKRMSHLTQTTAQNRRRIALVKTHNVRLYLDNRGIVLLSPATTPTTAPVAIDDDNGEEYQWNVPTGSIVGDDNETPSSSVNDNDNDGASVSQLEQQIVASAISAFAKRNN